MKKVEYEFLTIPKVARELGLTPRTILLLIHKGDIPVCEVGERWMIKTVEFNRWLKERGDKK